MKFKIFIFTLLLAFISNTFSIKLNSLQANNYNNLQTSKFLKSSFLTVKDEEFEHDDVQADLSAEDQEKQLEKLDEEVRDALDHDDVSDVPDHEKSDALMNNEAAEEKDEIEEELKQSNGEEKENDDNDLEVD
jgi:hypothetical protein